MLKAMTRLPLAPALALLILSGCSRPDTAANPSADTPESKNEKAMEVVKLMHADDVMLQYVATLLPQMVDLQKKAHPEITDEFWNEFSKSFDTLVKGRSGEIVLRLAPIYAGHYTEAELDTIIAFYKSSAGQKVVQEGQSVLQEGMKASQDWSNEIAQAAATQATETLRPKSP